MVEQYSRIAEWFFKFFNDITAETLGLLLFFMAGWFMLKRRQVRAGTVCFIGAALIAFGYTLIVYVRRLHG